MSREDPRRRLGAEGERLAAAHLEAAGYVIVERNFRTRYGELDLVASDGESLVFCEVKTRLGRAGARIGPLDGVGAAKRRRLRLMAAQWFAERSTEARTLTAMARFDAIGIVLAPDGRLLGLDHVEDAF